MLTYPEFTFIKSAELWVKPALLGWTLFGAKAKPAPDLKLTNTYFSVCSASADQCLIRVVLVVLVLVVYLLVKKFKNVLKIAF